MLVNKKASIFIVGGIGKLKLEIEYCKINFAFYNSNLTFQMSKSIIHHLSESLMVLLLDHHFLLVEPRSFARPHPIFYHKISLISCLLQKLPRIHLVSVHPVPGYVHVLLVSLMHFRSLFKSKNHEL